MHMFSNFADIQIHCECTGTVYCLMYTFFDSVPSIWKLLGCFCVWGNRRLRVHAWWPLWGGRQVLDFRLHYLRPRLRRIRLIELLDIFFASTPASTAFAFVQEERVFF